MKVSQRLADKVKRGLKLGAKVGAVGVAIGMGLSSYNKQQVKKRDESIARGMAMAEREGKKDDIRRLMESYNKEYGTSLGK